MLARAIANLPSIFMGFIAVGVGVILTFSWAYRRAPGGAWHWTMVALVVGLMVVYGAVLWIRSKTHETADGDGETFYYLGFIYTLATLVATFVPLLNSGERPETRHVLGMFGLGLITTFVGLAGRIVFAQTVSDEVVSGPVDNARRLGDAYAEAARSIERSTMRIVRAQERAEGHLNEAYADAVDSIHLLSGRATEQLEVMSAQVLTRFAAVVERVGGEAESAFTELRNRAIREIDVASSQAAKSHERAKEQVDDLAVGTASAVRTVTEHVVQDFTRIARESATELTAFLHHASRNVTGALQEVESRLAALRLPPEDVGQKLAVILTELTERAELLRQTSAKVGAVYGEFEGVLGNAVQGAQDGSRAFQALTVSTDAATAAVTSAKTNVERFGQQLTQLGDLTAGFEKFPQEAATIIAALSSLRTNLGEANRAWAEVAEVTDGASESIARAGAALSTLEHGTQAAEQSVLNWSGGLTKASVGLEALSEIAERAVRLGNDAVTTQVRLSAQLSGPLADQLRNQGEAASALVKRLQEDLRTSEEAVRKVHHHLIDASRFILSKVEYRR
jgi:hypothetical protein